MPNKCKNVWIVCAVFASLDKSTMNPRHDWSKGNSEIKFSIVTLDA